jgi:(p)ppGpp synthase/HD superfamily hydrolase
VTGLVLEEGGDETEAIAAMLHDAVEDGGGRPVLERIRTEFGDRVAEIVEGCSDTLDPGDERSWAERKRDHVRDLAGVDDAAVLRVTLADKVHNARSIVRDYREEGQALWDRFGRRSPDDQLAYYGALLELFGEDHDGPLLEDLRRAVTELADLVESQPRS